SMGIERCYNSDESSDSIKKDEALGNKLLTLGIKIEPERIDEEGIDNSLTLSRLSASSDINVKTLSDESLELYIQELITYLKVKGDIGELKEETAKIFAAWRLNSSYREQVYRGNYTLEEIMPLLNLLEDAIITYPYKLGYINVYLLLLLRFIEESNSGYKELEDFLLKIKRLIKESYENTSKLNPWNDAERDEILRKECFISVYFPAIRIRILKIISNNWQRFNEEQKTELRNILEKALLKWYAFPRVYWEELYTMYTSFFIMRVRLPLYVSKTNEDCPSFLLNKYKTYYTYLFTPRDKQEKIHNDNVNNEQESNEEKKIALKTGIHLLKAGLSWCKFSRKYKFTEIDYLIYSKLQKNVRLNLGDKYTKLSFAKIAPDRLKKHDWKILTETESKSLNEEFAFEMYDFLQLIIKLYFEKPNTYQSIMEWCESTNDNEFLRYVQNRFSSYEKIRKHFSLTNEDFASLESMQKDEEKIPIGDLVF